MCPEYQITASDLSRRLGACLKGDPSHVIRGLASPANATEKDVVVFFCKETPFLNTRAQAAVVARDYAPTGFRALLHVDEPRIALATLSAVFCPLPHGRPGQHPMAYVSPEAEVHETASIGPLCVVEAGARIGAGTTLMASCFVGPGVCVGASCLLYPGVVVYAGTMIGERVIVHANATLGHDGFAFVTESPLHPKVHSLGQLFIEYDVEIGSGTGIQRGTLDPTRIGKGTKIGSRIEIGHNCHIGAFCLLVGQIGIAGSVTLGDRVFVAAGVCIRDHVTIGDRSRIMMGSCVVRDAPAGSVLLGSPAQDHLAEKERYKAITELANTRSLDSEQTTA